MSIVVAVALSAAPPTFAAGSYYCQPVNGRDQITKAGSICPIGYVSTGRCCRALRDDTRRAIPKIAGAACPAGWFASSGYCVSLR
jgi:hypothetical protein